MKIKVFLFVFLAIIVSIAMDSNAQGIFFQKNFNKVQKLLDDNEMQEMQALLLNLEKKHPLHPLVAWYKFHFHFHLFNDKNIFKSYNLLDNVSRLYSLASPKEKKIIHKYFKLKNIISMYSLLDSDLLNRIKEKCNSKEIEFFQNYRTSSSHFDQLYEIIGNCEIENILESPTKEKLNNFISENNKTLKSKAMRILDSLVYINFKKKYRFNTALKFHKNYPNHSQIKSIEKDLYHWYTLDGSLDSFIKYVLYFENSSYREEALKHVILLKYNEKEFKNSRSLTIKQDSLQAIENVRINFLDIYQINKQWNVLLLDGKKNLLPKNIGELAGGFPCNTNIPYFIFTKKRKTTLFNLIGEKIQFPHFDSIEIKRPFLIFKINNTFSVATIGVHKMILQQADELKEVGDNWIIFRKNDKDGIVFLNGHIPTVLSFDNIETQNDNFIFTNNGKKNTLSFEKLLTFIRNRTYSLPLLYDDVNWLYDNIYLIKIGDFQGLIDANGQEKIKLGLQKITYKNPFILVKTEKELIVKDAKSFVDIINTQEMISHNLDLFHKNQSFWLTPYAPELAADEVEWIINNVWIVNINQQEHLYFSTINRLLQIPKSVNLIIPSVGNDQMIDVQNRTTTLRINQMADTVMIFNGHPLINFSNNYFVSPPLKKGENLLGNFVVNKGYFINQKGERIWGNLSYNVEKINNYYATGSENNKYIIYELKHRYKSKSLKTKPNYIKSSFFYVHESNQLEIIDMKNPKNKTILNADTVVKLDTLANPPYIWIKKENAYSCFTLDNPIDTLVFKAEKLNFQLDKYIVYTTENGKKGMITDNLHIKPRWDGIDLRKIDENVRIKCFEKNTDIYFSRYYNWDTSVLFDKFEPINTIWYKCPR